MRDEEILIKLLKEYMMKRLHMLKDWAVTDGYSPQMYRKKCVQIANDMDDYMSAVIQIRHDSDVLEIFETTLEEFCEQVNNQFSRYSYDGDDDVFIPAKQLYREYIKSARGIDDDLVDIIEI